MELINNYKESFDWRYCVVGNIIKDRIDESGQLKHGCKEFSGGTKVYLCGKYWDDQTNEISVIGLSRLKRHGKKCYRVVNIPISFIENVRASKVYRKEIVEIMNNKSEGNYYSRFWWSNSKEDQLATKMFADKWNNKI